MIGYEPGDPLKFQVLDYDEKGGQRSPKVTMGNLGGCQNLVNSGQKICAFL